MSSYKVLVLGANGMLGKMVSLYLDSIKDLTVDITSRTENKFVINNFEKNYQIFDTKYTNQEDNTQIKTLDQCSADLSVKLSRPNNTNAN